jgi:prevent-host-death family protein
MRVAAAGNLANGIVFRLVVLFYCTIVLYTWPMNKLNKTNVPFTEVRQNLTAILDHVQKSGKPVTILRRGKPAAVIIPHDMYEETITKKKPPFRLAGSFKVASGVDLNEVLAKAKQERIELWQKRIQRLRDELK